MKALVVQRRASRRRLKAELEARSVVFEDALTGIPNRRQYEVVLKAALIAPPGSDGAHAILMIDLNSFKRINDGARHPAGNGALIQVGSHAKLRC
jgi:diguanylate cyclase (GGDEF)-like protein